MNENELFKAISENDIEKVKNLVKNGVNVNAITHSNRTILIDASWKGYLEIVKCLVENGADINAKDDFGRTALIWASYDGKLGVVKYLVDKGADINVKDNEGYTALIWALIFEKFNVVAYFIENCKVDIDAQYNIKYFNNVKDGIYTILMIASMKGHLEIVKYLVDKGADINIEDDKCDTALNMICSNSDNNKKYNQIKEVLMKAWQRKN